MSGGLTKTSRNRVANGLAVQGRIGIGDRHGVRRPAGRRPRRCVWPRRPATPARSSCPTCWRRCTGCARRVGKSRAHRVGVRPCRASRSVEIPARRPRTGAQHFGRQAGAAHAHQQDPLGNPGRGSPPRTRAAAAAPASPHRGRGATPIGSRSLAACQDRRPRCRAAPATGRRRRRRVEVLAGAVVGVREGTRIDRERGHAADDCIP